MPSAARPRVAILGLMLESNRFAPVVTEEEFVKRVYLAGDEILEDLRSPDPKLPTEIRGFAAAMDAHGSWEPVPILVGLVEAGGPLDHAFFAMTLDEMRRRLKEAGPLDAVYISNHGAMITTENADPDGEIFCAVRAIVVPHLDLSVDQEDGAITERALAQMEGQAQSGGTRAGHNDIIAPHGMGSFRKKVLDTAETAALLLIVFRGRVEKAEGGSALLFARLPMVDMMGTHDTL